MERGRPKTISEPASRQIRLIARYRPTSWARRFLRGAWPSSRSTGVRRRGGLDSRESVRQILRTGQISWQATKTRKASADPDFITKMRRVLDLYDHQPADGRWSAPIYADSATTPRGLRCRL